MSSLVVYLTIISITVFFTIVALKSNEKKKIYFFNVLSVLFPSVFAALRYNIGTDYQIHQQVFEEISQGIPISKRAEIGYVLLNKVVAIVGGPYNVLLFLVALISIGCIYYTLYFFKNEICVPVAMLAYMLLYYQMSFNFIRQMLATSVALLATVVFLQKKKALSIIICCIAASFHITALIYIPVLLLYDFFSEQRYQHLRNWVYIALTLLVFLYPFILMPVLEQVQEWIPSLRYFINYLAVEYKPLGFGMFRYILLFIVPGVLFYKTMVKTMRFYYNVSLLGFIMWLTSYVTQREFYRISYTYLIMIIILIGYFWKNSENVLQELNIKKSFTQTAIYKHRELIFKMLLLALMIFFWYYDYFYLKSHETVPYISILGSL